MKNPFNSNKRKFRALDNRLTFLESALETYFTSPVYEESASAGFNGQKIRKMIFDELCNAFSFEAIVETGTYTGNTTGYISKKTALPVYTCESDRVLSALARKRLAGFQNLNFFVADSRKFLRDLANTGVTQKRTFFYLDAHGYDDLPLKTEIETICQAWKDFVIMIDDFQVPGDPGYGYDKYTGNQILSMEVFSTVFQKNNLQPYFPARPSQEETGHKQGCVILVPQCNLPGISRCTLLKQAR